jgi:hypothetical protein
MAFPETSRFKEGLNALPTTQCHLNVSAIDNNNIVTGNVFTITSTNSAATLNNVGGRPCIAITNTGSTATDVTNFCGVVASIIPQASKRIWLRFGVRMTTITQDFAAGLAVVGTNIINSDPTDHMMIRKLSAATQPSIRSRKASGTAETWTLPLTFAADTWYDIALEIVRDPSTAGAGKINVYGASGATPGGLLPLLGTLNVAAQLPDTVKQAPFFAFRAGSAANVSCYVSDFSVTVEA